MAPAASHSSHRIEYPRCFCCESLLRADGYCYLCDSEAVRVSPPHRCIRSGRVISDEHGCEPEELSPLEKDHETEWKASGRSS